MSDRTFCNTCGKATTDGAAYCDAHEGQKKDERTWCAVCGAPTVDGAERCERHEARRALEASGEAWCSRCGRENPCTAHDDEAPAGELEAPRDAAPARGNGPRHKRR